MTSSVATSSLRSAYEELCLALNMDEETRRAGWKNYETVRRTYLIEGEQLHWLSVSLFVCCSLSESAPNPVSIDRLLKCSKAFGLREFFSKVQQWANMTNLTEEKRKKFDRLEKSFFISSTIYQKYPRLFVFVFGGSEEKLLRVDFAQQRQLAQLNRKFAKKKDKAALLDELFSLGWTIFALAKSRYPATFVDLSASFHLLVAAVAFLHRLHAALLAPPSSSPSPSPSTEGDGELLSLLAAEFRCEAEVCSSIFVAHFLGESFWTSFVGECGGQTEPTGRSSLDDRLRAVSRRIHRSYDELVLSNCFVDERLFFLQAADLLDQLPALNENRASAHRDNHTPLTAHHQLFASAASPTHAGGTASDQLTPLSLTRHLIEQFHSLVEPASARPLDHIRRLIGNDTCFEHLQGLLAEWKTIYDAEYSRFTSLGRRSPGEKSLINLSERYFELALKFFSSTLAKVLLIEEKKHPVTTTTTAEGGRPVDQLRQSREKFFYNVEFFKSLFGLSLLLVFFVHGDEQHDHQWIFQIYSLHPYSFLKIIQIFLKTRKDLQRIRSLVKHLSKVEERIFSSLVWKRDSTFWTEFHRKGFLAFDHVFPSKASLHAATPQHDPFLLSPSPSPAALQHEHVNRKLFHAPSTPVDDADGSVEVPGTKSKQKSSPYTMFYRKLYQLALYRLDLLAKRLFGPTKCVVEKFAWNLFHFLLRQHFEELLCERDLDHLLLAVLFFTGDHFHRTVASPPVTWVQLLHTYKSTPNSRVQLLRSVFLYPDDERRGSPRPPAGTQTPVATLNQCLTPSKPAGTTSLQDGVVFGDITNFYEEIFLRLPGFPLTFLRWMDEDTHLLDYPSTILRAQQIATGEHRHIHFASTNQLPSTDKALVSPSPPPAASASASANFFSTSKSAGLKSRVQTTRMRTDEGKFFTTISTINDEERRAPTTAARLFNEENLFFGHFQPSKRPNDPSPADDDDRDTSSLKSLTKKVLLIETDRTNL